MKIKQKSLYFIYFWLAVFCFIPLTYVFLTSFLSKDSANLAGLPFTLSNYTTLFSPLFFKVLWRSFAIAFAATAGCVVLAYPFCYLIVKSRFQSVWLLLVIIPFWTSSLVRTYALVAILKFNGLLNAVLLKLHLISKPLSLLYTNFAVLSGLIYDLFPFMVLPIFISMERFDFRLIEAAQDLGASRFAIFYRVLLPNTISGIYSGCLLTFLPAMTLFYIPDILGGARSILVGNVIQNQFLVLENWPQGAATSVFVTMILMITMVLIHRYTTQKAHQ